MIYGKQEGSTIIVVKDQENAKNFDKIEVRITNADKIFALEDIRETESNNKGKYLVFLDFRLFLDYLRFFDLFKIFCHFFSF